MAERSCKKCFHYKACKEVVSHSGYGDICYTESQCKHFIFIDDVAKVVKCKDCAHKGSAFCMAGDFPLTKENENCYCSYGARTPKERGGEK